MYNDFGRAQCSAEVEVRVARPPPEPPKMMFESRSISSSIEMEEKSTLAVGSRRQKPQNEERESISSQIRLPTPSKFQKRALQVEFSDYESDWGMDSRLSLSSSGGSAKIQPKWRPYHSDTEDLGEPPKYRSVKPKLKEVKKRQAVEAGRGQSSPPCSWESHQDIENLQKELRKKPKEFKSRLLSSSALQLETIENSSVVKRPAEAETTLALATASTTAATSSSSRIKTEKYSSSTTIREFISVKEKAKLLQEMVNSHPDHCQTGESSAASTSEMTLKPEEIPGAVRVLPPASGCTVRKHRSASADIFKHPLTPFSSSSSSSLVRQQQRSKSTDLEQQQQHKKFETKFSSPSTTTSTTHEESEKVLIIRSKLLHSSLPRLPHHQHRQKRQEDEEESQEIEEDSPPTIEMTATRCEGANAGEETTDNNNTHSDYFEGGGYEADTENTLKKKKLMMFQPTKFVPRLTEDNDNGGSPIWKPRNNIL